MFSNINYPYSKTNIFTVTTPILPPPGKLPGNGPKYGNYYFGQSGFFYKKQVGVGGRKNPKYGLICNQPQYLYNKYKPGNNGVGAQSTANRRAKNRLSTICGPQKMCGNFYNYLGRYDPYLYNPNGYIQVPTPTDNLYERRSVT
jgi:hypothetical protein